MRYDLAFLLCCCKSFLGSDFEDDNDETNATNDENGTGTNADPTKPGATNTNKKKTNYNDYYALLAVDRTATPDEIKRAYKRQSLQMHPDKLAQKGVTVTAELQTRFTKMKEAYEVLSDPHKRDTYDALGARGVQWLEEPLAVDPAVLAHNFAKSSTLDRSKIFAIFVVIAVAVLILPVLICLHVDGRMGQNASWVATLVPLWIWNVVLILYHARVLLMGPIQRPEHVPVEEWVDPLPMNKRIFSLVRFLLIVTWEILVALKLDGVLGMSRVPWSVVFVPLYIWEATTLYKKWPLARMRIVTVEDLEAALGKPFSEFTPAEKELIGQRYSVVSSTSSPDFDAAQKLKQRARNDVARSAVRIVFVLIVLIQLDGNHDWNWYLVFLPIWIMSLVVCCEHYQAFAEVQKMAMEKDPNLFAPMAASVPPPQTSSDTDGATGTGAGKVPTTSYGAVGEGGGATTAEAAANANAASTLTEEEREQLRAHVTANSSKLCNKCCSQGFLLFILVLLVAKLQGAGFSAFWIISPFLFVAGILLCCIGCAIFGITEVSTDGINFDASGDFAYMNAEAGTAAPNANSNNTNTTASPTTPNDGAHDASNPNVYVPPTPAPAQQQADPSTSTTAAASSTTAEDTSSTVPITTTTTTATTAQHDTATMPQGPDDEEMASLSTSPPRPTSALDQNSATTTTSSATSAAEAATIIVPHATADHQEHASGQIYELD